MNPEQIIRIWGLKAEQCSITPVKTGLINSAYFIEQGDQSLFLQKINKQVFTNPRGIVSNYLKLYQHITSDSSFFLPRPLPYLNDQFIYEDSDHEFWRALELIKDSTGFEKARSTEQISSAASCFGKFTATLQTFDAGQLEVIIPGFHDLEWRYQQFQTALEQAIPERKNRADQLIRELEKRNYIVAMYKQIRSSPEFKLRVMHHDAKLSNILFHKNTGAVICPVDLDTTQPGYIFSDFGDMVRSMACSENEQYKEVAGIRIVPENYKAIFEGYMTSMRDYLTEAEEKNIHVSGMIMTYMQSLRFLADYLTGDHYYRIDYPGQNMHRALNQLTLLQSLEAFLIDVYHINPETLS